MPSLSKAASSSSSSSSWSLLLLVALLGAAAMMAVPASAQVPTGQSGVCCANILNSRGAWQLVCNRPQNVPGALAFPAGTNISGTHVGTHVVSGQIAQCVGRFPFPNPTPYKLPSNTVQLRALPNRGRCAGQLATFFQVLVPDGSFVVRCTN